MTWQKQRLRRRRSRRYPQYDSPNKTKIITNKSSTARTPTVAEVLSTVTCARSGLKGGGADAGGKTPGNSIYL